MQKLEESLLTYKKNYFGNDLEDEKDNKLKRDIYEFRLSPMSLNECHYNIILCYICVSHHLNALLLDDSA